MEVGRWFITADFEDVHFRRSIPYFALREGYQFQAVIEMIDRGLEHDFLSDDTREDMNEYRRIFLAMLMKVRQGKPLIEKGNLHA